MIRDQRGRSQLAQVQVGRVIVTVKASDAEAQEGQQGVFGCRRPASSISFAGG